MSSNHVITWIAGVERLGRHVIVWLQANVRECRLGLLLRLYVISVCVLQRHCSCTMWLVALYK